MPNKKKVGQIPTVIEMQMRNAHSLFIGHRPEGVTCEEGFCENILSTKTPEDIASFGLFGGNNNMNTFYPGIEASDWTPVEADFIEPVFRAFSETIVVYMGMPIDFGVTKGLLKEAVSMLKGTTINTNHETETENAIGAVSKAFYQEGYKANGVKVPGGINGVFKIDAKSNPRIARGILMDPPSIHSNSVTVRFKHEPSHSQLTREEFWDQLGTYDKKGEMVRLIATKIIGFKETSLVNHGADPYAQITHDGVIQYPKYASKVYSFRETKSFNHKPHKNLKNMELKLLLTQLGLQDAGIEDWDGLVAHFKAAEEAPEVALYNALTAVSEDITPESLTALQENQAVEGSVVLTEGQSILEPGQVVLKENETVLTEADSAILAKVSEANGIDELTTNAELGAKHISDIKAKAVADYKLVNGDAAQEAIIASINNADLTTAKAFEVQFHSQLEKEMPLACNKCQSTEVSRASSHKEPKKDEAENSYEESRDKAAFRTRGKASDIHKKD